LFLLAPTVDPEELARWLMPQLDPPNELPPDGAVVPVWVDKANTCPCDVQSKAEPRAKLGEAPVVAVAMADAYASRVVYQQLDPDIPINACAAVAEAFGKMLT
jgi:hypothetical protein